MSLICAYPLICICLAIKEKGIKRTYILETCKGLYKYQFIWNQRKHLCFQTTQFKETLFNLFHFCKAFFPFQPELKSFYISTWKFWLPLKRINIFSSQTIRNILFYLDLKIQRTQAELIVIKMQFKKEQNIYAFIALSNSTCNWNSYLQSWGEHWNLFPSVTLHFHC